jgi:hypothetical protein
MGNGALEAEDGITANLGLVVKAKGTGALFLRGNSIQTTGSFLPETNNTFDLGNTSSQRFRTAYLGTSLNINSAANQIVLGSGAYNITLSASATVSNKTLTIPDETGTIATQEWATANISGGGGLTQAQILARTLGR